MTFSVLLPTWNRVATIDAAVDSVLAQTYQDFELVISDDGSEDGTVAHLRERYAADVATGKIVLLEGEHKGVTAARNRALSAAHGTWIAYVDSDNRVRPDFLESFASAIAAEPEARAFNAKFRMQPTGEIRGKPYDRKALVERNYIDMGVFVHSRDIYEALGGFDETMRRLVDWELVLRYTQRYPPAFVDAVVMDYDDERRDDRITMGKEPFCAWRQSIWNRYACEKPLVTTIVTSYNHAAYVREAVDSALRQEGPFRHEILLSDDGSTDGTADIMTEYAAMFPYVVRNVSSRENRGISANMKACFEAAQGEYVAILEGDDFWSDKHKLAEQMAFLQKHTSSPMVFSRTEICDSDGGGRRYSKIQGALPELLRGRDMFDAGSSSVIINFSSCMFRRSALSNLPDALWKPRLSEVALSFHLERSGPIGYIGKPMSVYRQHSASTFTGAGHIGRRQQEIACRQVARAVCAPEYVPYFDREIAAIDETIRLQMERSIASDGRHAWRLVAVTLRSALKCYRENGLRYTLRRIFFGRQY